jgi:OmpA-OmpF porin, OOP family
MYCTASGLGRIVALPAHPDPGPWRPLLSGIRQAGSTHYDRPPRHSGTSGRAPDPSSSPVPQEMPMKSIDNLRLMAACAVLAVGSSAMAQNAAVDVGSQVPDAAAVKEGLFPEDACKELEANGFKCMGFKPAIRYSLPASSFRIGSAELPELLKKQLDVFAEVLKNKKGSGRQVRVIGHADASGTPEANQALSLKRAEAVKGYLVAKGADPEMLVVVGVGSKDLKNASNPTAAENRRVEIGRQSNP